MTFQLVLLIILSAFVVLVLLLPEQDALRKLVVLLVISILILFSAWPELSTKIANWFGIGRGSDFLFYISHVMLFFIAFMYYLKFREMEMRLTRLVRYLAIAEAGRDAKDHRNDFPDRDKVGSRV